MAEQEFKYLAIRNWAKWQTTTDKNGKSLEGRARPYIRDYCDKETDSQYAALSITARYLFDACRRLKGKTGRNLPNDHMWILRQLDVDPTERGRATHALAALITRGLLIPTNQQVDILQPAAPSLSVEVPVGLENINTDTATGTVELSTDSSTGEQEDQNQNQNPSAFNVSGDWLDDLVLDEAGQRKFACVMRWKETLSDFWKGKELKSLKAYRTVEGQYDKFYAKLPGGKKPHDLPVHPKPKAAAAPSSQSLGDSPAPDKCICEDPLPDPYVDCAEAYGVSCRRCGKFVKYPEDREPSYQIEENTPRRPRSKAFQVED